jgi:hypothetical protein
MEEYNFFSPFNAIKFFIKTTLDLRIIQAGNLNNFLPINHKKSLIPSVNIFIMITL